MIDEGKCFSVNVIFYGSCFQGYCFAKGYGYGLEGNVKEKLTSD